MKKVLLNASLMAALGLSTHVGWSDPGSASPSKSFYETLHPTQRVHFFSQMLSMETPENLKAYHVGLQCLFPHYHIPSKQDLLSSIRSHPEFVGCLTQADALKRFAEENSAYFIFEEKGNPGHFYMTHLGGSRHFTVNDQKAAGIDNAMNGCFPTLKHFTESTLTI